MRRLSFIVVLILVGFVSATQAGPISYLDAWHGSSEVWPAATSALEIAYELGDTLDDVMPVSPSNSVVPAGRGTSRPRRVAVPRGALPDGPAAKALKVMVIPEPREWAMLVLGLAGLVLVRHRARS